MSEFGVRTPEVLREAVRASENQVEEEWREQVLARFLFHDEHLNQTISDNYEDALKIHQLEQDFLEDKRGLNMGERFALALSDKYLGKVHVAELGSTTDPAADGAVDGLKHEYHDLLQWMQQKGLVEKELSRQESGRTLSMRPPRMNGAASHVTIVTRNRPLVRTTIEHAGKEVSIFIAKRMVFSLPYITAITTQNRFPGKSLNSEEALHFIENTFLHHGSGGIQPIRTTYYLGTDIK